MTTLELILIFAIVIIGLFGLVYFLNRTDISFLPVLFLFCMWVGRYVLLIIIVVLLYYHSFWALLPAVILYSAWKYIGSQIKKEVFNP